MTQTPTAILTFSGKGFDAWAPRAADICIEDIAHALSLINRYMGHSPKPYSVAQHSYLCSKMAPTELRLQALMHDAHEAYVGDMPRPMKKGLPEYRDMEQRVQDAVRDAFHLPRVFDPIIKEVDHRMYLTESKAFGRVLFAWDNPGNLEPYAELADLEPWPWHKAKQRFLDRFRCLGG